MIHLSIAAALLIAAPLPASSQSPLPEDQAAAPDPAAVEAALRMFEGMDVEGIATASALQMADAALQTRIEQSAAEGEELPPELVERVRAVLLEEVKSLTDGMMQTIRLDMARIYARHFTRDEIVELTRLQQNPVMRKMTQVGPRLQAELATIGMKAAAARQDDIQARVLEVIAEWAAEQAASDTGDAT